MQLADGSQKARTAGSLLRHARCRQSLKKLPEHSTTIHAAVWTTLRTKSGVGEDEASYDVEEAAEENTRSIEGRLLKGNMYADEAGEVDMEDNSKWKETKDEYELDIVTRKMNRA